MEINNSSGRADVTQSFRVRRQAQTLVSVLNATRAGNSQALQWTCNIIKVGLFHDQRTGSSTIDIQTFGSHSAKASSRIGPTSVVPEPKLSCPTILYLFIPFAVCREKHAVRINTLHTPPQQS